MKTLTYLIALPLILILLPSGVNGQSNAGILIQPNTSLLHGCESSLVFDLGHLSKKQFEKAAVVIEGAGVLRQVKNWETRQMSVTIIPEDEKVLSIVNETDSFSVDVMNFPKPSLQLMVNGRLWSEGNPVSMKSTISFSFDVETLLEYVCYCGSKFRIDGLKLITTNHSEIQTLPRLEPGMEIDLGEVLKNKYVPGTIIYIQVEGITRIKCDESEEIIKYDERELTMGITLK